MGLLLEEGASVDSSSGLLGEEEKPAFFLNIGMATVSIQLVTQRHSDRQC